MKDKGKTLFHNLSEARKPIRFEEIGPEKLSMAVGGDPIATQIGTWDDISKTCKVDGDVITIE